jgi:hypothetical protein
VDLRIDLADVGRFETGRQEMMAIGSSNTLTLTIDGKPVEGVIGIDRAIEGSERTGIVGFIPPDICVTGTITVTRSMKRLLRKMKEYYRAARPRKTLEQAAILEWKRILRRRRKFNLYKSV